MNLSRSVNTGTMLLSIAIVAGAMGGCRSDTRQDTVLQWAANPSRTYRATVLLRQYYVDGKFDTSPTTYVLLDRDAGRPDYENGQDFKDSQIAVKASQCGTLRVHWSDDSTLRVECEQCGIALSAVAEHASGVGSIRVLYEGFPAQSSWEPGPRRD